MDEGRHSTANKNLTSFVCLYHQSIKVKKEYGWVFIKILKRNFTLMLRIEK